MARIMNHEYVDEDELGNQALIDAAWATHERNDTVMACLVVAWQQRGVAMTDIAALVRYTAEHGMQIGLAQQINEQPSWHAFPDIPSNDDPRFLPAVDDVILAVYDES